MEWKVEYSVDGLPFIDAGRIFVLRPVVYNDAVIKDLGLRRLSYDAALGFTEYSVPLPVSLLGHKRLTVRLTPASAVMATIPENPISASPSCCGWGGWPSGRSDDEKARCSRSGLFL